MYLKERPPIHQSLHGPDSTDYKFIDAFECKTHLTSPIICHAFIITSLRFRKMYLSVKVTNLSSFTVSFPLGRAHAGMVRQTL